MLRQFSTSARNLLKDSSKKSAIALNTTAHFAKDRKIQGNSFQSFKDYRKSATQHGPLKKNFMNYSLKKTEPIWTNENDYGVSEKSKSIARSFAYRE